jgi:hypothetical protein
MREDEELPPEPTTLAELDECVRLMHEVERANVRKAVHEWQVAVDCYHLTGREIPKA